MEVAVLFLVAVGLYYATSLNAGSCLLAPSPVKKCGSEEGLLCVGAEAREVVRLGGWYPVPLGKPRARYGASATVRQSKGGGRRSRESAALLARREELRRQRRQPGTSCGTCGAGGQEAGRPSGPLGRAQPPPPLGTATGAPKVGGVGAAARDGADEEARAAAAVRARRYAAWKAGSLAPWAAIAGAASRST